MVEQVEARSALNLPKKLKHKYYSLCSSVGFPVSELVS